MLAHCILNGLETIELRRWKGVVNRVKMVQTRMNERSGNSGGCVEVQSMTNRAEVQSMTNTAEAMDVVGAGA